MTRYRIWQAPDGSWRYQAGHGTWPVYAATWAEACAGVNARLNIRPTRRN